MKREPVKTDDGSYTLFVPELNEHYHSTHGALQESRHVFLKSGFEYIIERKHNQIKVLEVGFGTGLNALVTAIEAEKRDIKVEFTTIEAHPLSMNEVPPLNEDFSRDEIMIYKLLHEVPWESIQKITNNFSIKKLYHTLEDIKLEDTYHVIYHDAFGPDVQPGLWTEEIFKKLHRHTITDGVLVTFSAKGAVKRALKAAGYKIESIPGPTGKREITRAKRID